MLLKKMTTDLRGFALSDLGYYCGLLSKRGTVSDISVAGIAQTQRNEQVDQIKCSLYRKQEIQRDLCPVDMKYKILN